MLLSVSVLAPVLALLCSRTLLAQDAPFFRPTLEPTPTRKSAGPPPVFSFSRFEPDLRSLCVGMEVEGRRERFVSIAEQVLESDKGCISCKSIWRSVISACGKLGPKPTPRPKAQGKKRPPTKPEPEAEGSAEQPEEAPTEGVDQGAALPPQRKARTPSTELLDSASQFGVRLYNEDQGGGSVATTFAYVVKTVNEFKGLSKEEREYYDTLFAYLLAPWEGRVDPKNAPTPTPPAKLHEFFEESR